MKTTIEALKALFTKLGGSNFGDANTIPDAIDKVTSVAQSGGSSLPEVTSADNGDVLTVVEGAWAKAEPRGGDFIVSADFAIGEEGGSPTISFSNLDKTGAEIIAAASTGNVILRGVISPAEGVTVGFDSHLSTITNGVDSVYGLVILHGIYPLVAEGEITNFLVTTTITINTETGTITGVTSTVGAFG